MHNTLLLVIVVGSALAFDFTNGFHDTANVVATSISTRAIAPRPAVALTAVANFAGAFISLKVAATIANDIVRQSAISETVVFAGLIGAIIWNLTTWSFGLPSSSSHALVGGVVGAAWAAHGVHAVLGQNLIGKIIVPAMVSPVLAFVVAGAAILAAYKLVGRLRPGPVKRGFRIGQIASSGLLALAHGTNDAQKTMGVITLALIADGDLHRGAGVPGWVVVAAATAIALGTYSGGWQIINTMGSRIIKMDPAQGFAAQTAGATTVLAASHFGYPLSTTHVINGGIVGAGAAKRLSAVRWGVAGNIAIAWVLTIPAAAVASSAVYALTRPFGHGATGPLIVSVIGLAGLVAILVSRVQRSPSITARRG